MVAVVERSDGAILAFERSDAPGSWQLPQGGINIGEEPIDAVWRELEEETGLTAADVALGEEYRDWVHYQWPAEVAAGRKGFGQIQRWFTFIANDDEVEPSPDGREFTNWKWVPRRWLIDHVVGFRSASYQQVLGTVEPA